MIDAQRRIVASLSACGQDVGDAEKLLGWFEDAQEFRLGEIDRPGLRLPNEEPLDPRKSGFF